MHYDPLEKLESSLVRSHSENGGLNSIAYLLTDGSWHFMAAIMLKHAHTVPPAKAEQIHAMSTPGVFSAKDMSRGYRNSHVIYRWMEHLIVGMVETTSWV